MKLKTIALFIIFTFVVTSYFGYLPLDRFGNESDLSLKPPIGSTEELYKGIFLSLLYPYIDEAVYGYYGESYRHYSKIINIDRPNGSGTLFFVITLEVVPFTGPHISVGVDHVTMTVSGGGKVEIIDFKHIKDYELPPHLKNPRP